MGAPETRARREAGAQGVIGRQVGAQAPRDVRDEVHDVGVALDVQELRAPGRCPARRRGRRRCAPGRPASRARRAPSRRRGARLRARRPRGVVRRDGACPAMGWIATSPSSTRTSSSGEAPAMREVAQREIEHVRRGVDRAQGAIDLERRRAGRAARCAAKARPGSSRRRGCTPESARRRRRSLRASAGARERRPQGATLAVARCHFCAALRRPAAWQRARQAPLYVVKASVGLGAGALRSSPADARGRRG